MPERRVNQRRRRETERKRVARREMRRPAAILNS